MPRQPRAVRYAVAPVAVLVTTLLHLGLPDPGATPFVIVPVAVVVSAWFGGRGPGMLAVALSALAVNVLFLHPEGRWSPGTAAIGATVLFVAGATVTVLLCAAFRDTALALAAQREATERSQRKLGLALQAGRAGYFDWDVASNRVAWSDELLALYGIRREAFGGTYADWRAAIVPEDRDAADESVRAALATGHFAHEFRIRRADTGEVRWLEGRGDLQRDAEGRPLLLVGLNADVTERRRAAEALRESEARFRDLADNIAQLAWMADETGTITWYNRRWLEYTGLGLEQMREGGRAKVLHPDHHDRVVERLERAFEEGVPWEDTFPLRGRDGEYRWFLSRAVPIRDADGRTVRWFGTNTDVTEQRAAEESARGAQQLLRATMDNFPTVVAFKDREGRFIAVNRVVEEVLHRPASEIVGRSMQDFIPAEAAEVLDRHDREVMTTRRARQAEEVTPLPDGTLHHVDTAFPLVAEDGTVYGTGHISHDITAVRRAELELRALNEQLREADRRKNEFLAVLSHELRNPLAPIRNSLFVLERAAPGGEQARQALAVVGRQVAHMARLVDDLLDLSRITRGKIRLQREALVLNDVVLGTADDFADQFERRGIDFDVAVEARPLHAWADRTRLAQVVGNLLHNAAKFTPRGGHVRLALVADGDAALVEVRDDGAGMDPALVGRLFEPFVQAHQTLDRSPGGLGLGLALVKGLVELHGGVIAAHSDGPGRGAVFTVRLPLVPAPAPRERRAEPRDAAPAALRILVIEDNADAALSLKQVIELGLGPHDVAVAHDGHEGLRRAREFRPHVVLCDIGLPGIDGFTVARALREDGTSADAVLVALTGYALPEDQDRARAAGFDHHMAKPPDLAALSRLLREAGRAVRL